MSITIPHDHHTPSDAQNLPLLTTAELDEFLDGLDDPVASAEVLAADTVLGRKGSGKPHGTAQELLASLQPDTWHQLGVCPWCPGAPTPKGKGTITAVDAKRTRITVMCWAPDEHSHPAEAIRTSADGRTYAVWTWGPNRKAQRDVVASDDQSVLADHILRLLAAQQGLLAVRDGIVHIYDADAGVARNGLQHAGASPTWGSWVPLAPDALAEFVRRALAKLSVLTPAKEEGGEPGFRPVRVTVHLISDVVTLMLRTLHARELLYVERMRKRGDISYDDQEAASSRFDFCRGTLLNPGTVLTDRAEIELARPDHHVPSEARIGFAPDSRYAGEWEEYVARMVPDHVDRLALQMWVGAAAVGGCATRLQQHAVLLGPAGTGKSQLIELVASIFPAAQRAAVSLAQLGDRFSPAGLVGKRLNVSPEADTETGRLPDIGRLKMILDGSTIQVERKNQQPVWSRITCAHLIGANSLPAGDAGEALYDRFRIVRASEVRMRHTDEAVAQWWRTKLCWRPAILAWAIDGLKKLDAAGWRLPKSASSKEAADDWRAEGDSVYDWVRHLPPPPEHRRDWASPGAAYDAYVAWCRAHGRMPLSDAKFGRVVKTLVEHTRTGGRAYRVSLVRADPIVAELFPAAPSVEEQIRAAWDAHDTERWAALVQAHPAIGAKLMREVC